MSEQTQNHKADLNSLNPALYVGTYGKYNMGLLNGGWVDITTFGSGKEFIDYCITVLHKDEPDPELMFQDFQNFPKFLFSESMSSQGIDEILQWWKEENAEREQEAEQSLKIVDYNEGVSIAIVGDTYPIRKKLKEMGGFYRNHKELGPCWVFSAKRREDLEKFIASGAQKASGTKKEPVDKPDKALLEEYLNEQRKVYPKDESMIEYYRKKTSRVIRLSNGGLMAFEKPSIETDFCFGYSDFGQGFSQKEANEQAKNARKEEYFMHENLKGFDESIKALSGELDDDYHYNYTYLKPYLYRVEYRNTKTNVWDYQWMKPYEVENEPWRTKGFADICLMSDDDRKLVIEAIKAERAAFVKRLETWWKRYGAEKLHIWTYWADE